ncbi:MAG: 2-octaprenyl-6-methoxyphenyl hydroxylase [bacterium]
MNKRYDIIIVGGGMVGASLATALSGRGMKIAVVESRVPAVESLPGYDDRAIALSEGSHRILESLDLWGGIKEAAEPITSIHVSERHSFGFSHLSAAEMDVTALGYVIPARQMGVTLLDRMSRCEDVDLIAPATVSAIENSDAIASLTLETDAGTEVIDAALVAAADGGNSFIRETLGVKTRRWDYGQYAVVANITPQKPHQGKAFERFTEAGPVALLPMTEQRCALVWTVDEKDYERVIGWNDAEFLAAFQNQFGWRLGRLTRIGQRTGYPLAHIRALESVRPRVAIIGNAAHTLHPVAGQGFNLGMRDVAALAEVVVSAIQQQQDIGSPAVLQQYLQWREGDQRSVAMATDGLVRLFTNPLPPLRWARNLGMLAVDLMPGPRRWVTRAAMGLQGRQPKLSRGLPLE